jgi:large subunit ribosomal protein L4
MEAISLPIYSIEGKEAGTLKLNSAIFDGVVNQDALHQAVCAYRANQRGGLAATKTRGEVSGGGKKPWRQKGTGRARVGSIRSPLWRHGGVVFGPHPRDFSYNLPQKIKSLALKSSLNAKVKDDNLIILEGFALASHKTKEAAALLAKWKSKSTLLLLDKTDENIRRALHNIGHLEVGLAADAHAYQVLTHEKVLITKGALDKLAQRFKQ